MNFSPKATTLVALRLSLVALAGVLFAVPGQGAQYVRGQLIPEVKLKNGTVLRDVTVVAVGATTVVARWQGGMGSLLLAQLPEEMRTDLAPPVAAAPVMAAPAPSAATAAPLDPKLASAELPTEIKLTNGFVMHKATVTRWEQRAVLVSYPGGIVTVQFKNISPAQRAIFEARKDDELARQAKDDAANAAGQSTAAQEQKSKQEAEETAAAEREAGEKKAEEIQNGVSFHYLVKGMTKAQVVQAFGKPPDDGGDTFLYLSRGKDKYGNSADRTLVFKDGLLTGWRDMRDGEPAGAVDH